MAPYYHGNLQNKRLNSSSKSFRTYSLDKYLLWKLVLLTPIPVSAWGTAVSCLLGGTYLVRWLWHSLFSLTEKLPSHSYQIGFRTIDLYTNVRTDNFRSFFYNLKVEPSISDHPKFLLTNKPLYILWWIYIYAKTMDS